MFLFKRKIWNYIQHDLGFDLFSPETVLFFMLYFISSFYELLTFYPRIDKDALVGLKLPFRVQSKIRVSGKVGDVVKKSYKK